VEERQGKVSMKLKKGKYFGTARVINTNDQRKTTNLERTTCNESLRSSKSAAFDSPVSIRIHSFRCRLADCDGVSGKAAIDSLVMCGVIKDDTTKEVSEVTYSQTKVKNKNEEKTVITIERA
jgi:hypothetical protein